MNIIEKLTHNITHLGIDIHVHSLIINVNNIKNRADEMIKTIQDTCWLNQLDVVARISYNARAQRTIDKLVNNILTQVEDEITEEFGEFMISTSAQDALVQTFGHVKVPLAELLKEKITGNPGFDFHTETQNNLISFGEAKFSGKTNKYTDALTQIKKFIDLKKHDAELIDLKNFVSKTAIENHINHNTCFIAAFSINSPPPENIIKNAIECRHLKEILDQKEIYLVGVTVNDN
ncbi:hypothetical protein [Morganella sp. GD04133]|uniref:hypothetical protein n=1 Tax=Morganella sp. GD04133 TaxID=2975435 RepID=UPI00244B94A1|nr:hypothetical protein [Morganella sp. GD04133]MDH0355080.1 hypothetical protein [Morganella sp. GD04133]